MTEKSADRLVCPQCQQNVTVAVQAGKTEPGPDDRVSCPTHGDIGRFEDVIKSATAIKHASEALELMLKGTGFPFTKG
jgi:hypothetical protein